ncbi:GTP 3',8-cyclase MoaA [Variovorax sp. LG9.2]|uniref:GTP 3',8-cyclase MoaA n=1 Tax=Variovorax sp. LG9.2 TaxID=3048626 RepID=UPI002B23717A|nr:GTP 3',8-cyclase MoaA [Variovorax sp. LG9.2]MEB0058510.1 GTP 3',8-cyclase MoaA [Variovorax sp. LG9.2]
MNARVIPLVDERSRLRTASVGNVVSDAVVAATGHLVDRLGRPLTDLRISVTDRCNFRCSYCMPKDVFDKNYDYLPHSALLSFEEITRLARLFALHGVRKIRLTGGEPLLRKNIDVLISQLAAIRWNDGTPEGAPLDLTLTTNASLLARKAAALKAAGLQRVTVSLDGLDDAVFRRMNDVDFPVADVLAGIDAAVAAGLGPIKINMVVKRGTNDQEIVPMARYFRDHYGGRVVLRFIEYMDVGATNGWRMDEVMPSSDVVARIAAEFPLVPLDASTPGETAQRWAYADGRGEIGVISSVTHAFCSDCSRARLSTEGQLYLCLFAHGGHDLRPLLRGDASDEQIVSHIGNIWQGRADRYSELRALRAAGDPGSDDDGDPAATPRRVEMSYIGG